MRLISIDPYWTSAGLKFVVVMVPNTGPDAKSWWWYFGIDSAMVVNYVKQNNAILVSARPYLDNGQLRYVAVMVENTEGLVWDWCVKCTTATIESHFKSQGLHVSTFHPNPLGDWDAIMVTYKGGAWYWWGGISSSELLNNVVAHKTRLIDLTTYIWNGVRYYGGVELGDNVGPQFSEK